MTRPLVLGVVVLQLGLPLTMLGARWADEGWRPVSERPASFQMYSATGTSRYTGVDRAGRSRELHVDDLPPVVRAIGTGRVVPDRLCSLHPDLVLVRRSDGPAPGEFVC